MELFGLARELNVEAEGIEVGPSPMDQALQQDLALMIDELDLQARSSKVGVVKMKIKITYKTGEELRQILEILAPILHRFKMKHTKAQPPYKVLYLSDNNR